MNFCCELLLSHTKSIQEAYHETSQNVLLILIGLVIIGIGASTLRVAGLGVDPFTAMNIGLSSMFGMQLGIFKLLSMRLFYSMSI